MRKIEKFIFHKILILLKTILFINFVNNSYCKQKTYCSQSAKEGRKKDLNYQEPIFINLPEKIGKYNEDLVKQIKNAICKEEKDKVTLEKIKNFVTNEIEMIKNRDYKEYNDEDFHPRILYIIKDNDLIASKILIDGDIDEKYYSTTINEETFSHCNYPKIKKANMDYWFENYLKEGVYNFDKLKEFWNKYKPTYLERYKKYPVFYFEKNETNKKYFEDPEKDKKK